MQPACAHCETGPATIVVAKVGELDELLAQYENHIAGTTSPTVGHGGGGGGGGLGNSRSGLGASTSENPGRGSASSAQKSPQLQQQFNYILQLQRELRAAEELAGLQTAIAKKGDAGAERFDTHKAAIAWKRAVLRTLRRQYLQQLTALKATNAHSRADGCSNPGAKGRKWGEGGLRGTADESGSTGGRRVPTNDASKCCGGDSGDSDGESGDERTVCSGGGVGSSDEEESEEGERSRAENINARNGAKNMFICVGSDDGYSDVTLLRVAILLSELCLFLCIEPYGGPNAAVLKQVMMYVEQRLGMQDVAFLTEAVEHLMNPAIIATGFTANPTALLDELVRQNLFAPHVYAEERQTSVNFHNITGSSGYGGGYSPDDGANSDADGRRAVWSLDESLSGTDHDPIFGIGRGKDVGAGVTGGKDENINDERVPGYAAVYFGHKLVLETSRQLADDAAQLNGLSGRFQLTAADRYLLHLITTAHFAVPLPQSYHEITSHEERRIRVLEHRLRRFGIHRHNVTRDASWRLVQKYCSMLRESTMPSPIDSEKDSSSGVCVHGDKKTGTTENPLHRETFSTSAKPAELERAAFFEEAFNELLAIMSLFPERVKLVSAHDSPQSTEGSADGRRRRHRRTDYSPLHSGGADGEELYYTTGGETYLSSVTTCGTMTRNQYHDVNVNFREMEDSVFTLHNLCFRNADFTGSVQLVWIPTTSHEDEGDKGDTGTGRGSALFTAPGAAASDGDPTVSSPFDTFSSVCPRGYGMVLVYFPPTTERDADRMPPRMTSEAVVYHDLAQEVLGSMEVTFNSFQWLLSPPVESYETPGLIHFAIVERSRSTGSGNGCCGGSQCTSGSLFRMIHQKPVEVQHAIMELRRVFAQCISRAHELLSLGYSEGLWGHVGMQFFYSVGTYSRSGGGIGAEGLGAAGSRSGYAPKVATTVPTSSVGRKGGGRVGDNEGEGRALPIPSSVISSTMSSFLATLASTGVASPQFAAPPVGKVTARAEYLASVDSANVEHDDRSGTSNLARGMENSGSLTGNGQRLFTAQPTASPVSASGAATAEQFMPPHSQCSTCTEAGAGLEMGGSLYGGHDQKKIPSSMLQHLVMRPTLITDTLESEKDKGVSRLIEVYAMFIGAMSPEEICWSIQRLLATKIF